MKKLSKAQLVALTFVAESPTPVELHEIKKATKWCLYRKGLLASSTYTQVMTGAPSYQAKCLVVTDAGLEVVLANMEEA